MTSLVVTTSRKASLTQREEAQRWAGRLGSRFVPRTGRSLAAVAQQEATAGVLVISGRDPVYYEPARDLDYFFHPSMAKPRIHNIKAGRGDPMVEAMQLGCGDSILDCTLGRGCDAIVASWMVGNEGKVVGVERIPILATLAAHGLANYEIKPADVQAALRRVQVEQADYHEFLTKTTPASFDVVYFDPIFDEPLEDSLAMAPLRALADARLIDLDALRQARRVARRSVVSKQRRGSSYWNSLPFPVETIAGSSSRIEYGRIAAGMSNSGDQQQ